MIICDSDIVIRAVDASRPGSSHDAFVFNMSNAKQHYLSKYEAGDRGSWLLGDSGFGIEEFLLTPYRDPNPGSPQHRFNLQHAKARNITERVIGVLKSRIRCLKTALPYAPQKVVKIINICCALHNICRHYQIEDFVETESTTQPEEIFEENTELEENTNLNNVGRNLRDSIANNLIL
ncbi:PREDICTED: putative nuclease HARBI1 [Rhagoletis zephyria]|uniref:putative nuclease HARBI1 n=1 Tax=Rhagoletis zephyria TaxID=28612 RepID=UPI0008113FEC|nr:PREDICTED: putative nuclease HARBI1 [Rhagoletis zephyria]